MAEENGAIPAGVQRDLASLIWRYGNLYTFTVHRGGTWRATRIGNGERLEAHSAEDLREKVRADLGRNPAPRLGTTP